MADRLDVDTRDRPVPSGSAKPGGWGRRVLTGLIALAALGGFAVVVVYSYDRGAQSAGDKVAPVVKAQEGPTRVRPETPGGMTIPNQDKQIYDRLGGQPDTDKVERLLPPPEPVVTKPPPMPKAEIPASSEPSVAAAPAVPPATNGSTDAAARHAAEAEPASGGASTAAETPVAQKPAPKPAPKPAAEQMAKIAKDAAKSAPAAANGAWRVQIASLRSEDAANRAWTTLRGKHADLFGKMSMRVVKADIKGKGTYYRVQAGPVSDAAAARSLCTKAKQRKIGCIIVRP